MTTGRCASCKAVPWEHAFQGLMLCSMCWTSPFYVARRKAMAVIPETQIDRAQDAARISLGLPSVKADGGGLRYDEGKERVDLIPADAMLEIGKVYGAGAVKYPARNWERGMPWSKCLGPLMRHLFKWMMGEKLDPEDGQMHIAKVAWNAIALLTYELRKIGVDDRGMPA